MAIKRIKDRTKLVGQFRLPSSSKRHYVMVYVWKTRADMVANTVGIDNRAVACHCPNTWGEMEINGVWQRLIPPLLGEIHYIVDDWDEEIASHEVMHAILHRIRVLSPDYDTMNNSMEKEEIVCLEFGRWFAKVWSNLWKYRAALDENAPQRAFDKIAKLQVKEAQVVTAV